MNNTEITDKDILHLRIRIRNALSYMLSALILRTDKKDSFMLVLSYGDLDEMMIGSLTKNASSGDINPIGSICKKHILQFLQYCQEKFNYSCLKSIIAENKKKEESLEITSEEMILMSKLRKEYKSVLIQC